MTGLRTYYIATFGCRVNQADSGELGKLCEAAGYRQAGSPAGAEIILVNSCTVTHRSDHDIRKYLRKLRREHPAARIILAGCYAERISLSWAEREGLWAVAGNSSRLELAELLRAAPDVSGGCHRGGPWAVPPAAVASDGHTRPFVKVQDGCDARCTYCIVPSVRGPSRSVPPAEVLAAVRQLVDEGAREILLTGIHLGDYGKGLTESWSLERLARLLLDETALERLRFSSIEPGEFTPALLDLIGREKRIAPHLHIPLQHGSAAVLARMNRPYRPEQYATLLGELTARRPGLALGADVMAGFPCETVDESEEMMEFIRRLPLTYLHVFPFSPRPGTPAGGMPGRPAPAVVKERCRRLRELSLQKKLAYVQSWQGVPLPALTLGPGPAGAGVRALTENYIEVELPGCTLPPNQGVWLVITAVSPSARCHGEIRGAED